MKTEASLDRLESLVFLLIASENRVVFDCAEDWTLSQPVTDDEECHRLGWGPFGVGKTH